jgi:hypothetical protein
MKQLMWQYQTYIKNNFNDYLSFKISIQNLKYQLKLMLQSLKIKSKY